MKIKSVHPLAWVADLLAEDRDYIRKKMFGCEAVYLGDRLSVVLAAGDEPWNGILCPTTREDQSALMKQWPMLKPHPILGKWLYLSQAHPEFETFVGEWTDRALKRDPRVGTIPQPKKKKKVYSR